MSRTGSWLRPARDSVGDDTGPVPAAWLLDGPGAAAVTVQAPLRELLLLVYRRRTPDGLPVTGDAGLLRHWLGHVALG